MDPEEPSMPHERATMHPKASDEPQQYGENQIDAQRELNMCERPVLDKASSNTPHIRAVELLGRDRAQSTDSAHLEIIHRPIRAPTLVLQTLPDGQEENVSAGRTNRRGLFKA